MATGATEGKILLKTTTGYIGIELWPQECPNTNSFNKNSNNKNNKIMISYFIKMFSSRCPTRIQRGWWKSSTMSSSSRISLVASLIQELGKAIKQGSTSSSIPPLLLPEFVELGQRN